MPPRVYLDANATTPTLRSVRAAMARVLEQTPGNASSPHGTGRAAARVLGEARARLAGWLGVRSDEVVLTSGGTEADRLAVLGALRAAPDRRHVVASAIEHPAVRDLLRALAADGRDPVEVSWIRPAADGRVDPEAMAAALRPQTALCCLMTANNETGVLQPVAAVAPVCRGNGTLLLADAVQTAGKEVLPQGAGADLVAVSAHKLHGPVGVGALIVRHGCGWRAPFPAAHERGRRGGTENVAGAAGFAEAAVASTGADLPAMAALRDRLERTVTGALGEVDVNGTAPRTPNTTNLLVRGVESDRLLALLDRAGVDASNGSACSAGTPDPSHVLVAMGRSRQEARQSVRFSLSRLTTSDEVDRAVAAVIESVETLRRGR